MLLTPRRTLLLGATPLVMAAAAACSASTRDAADATPLASNAPRRSTSWTGRTLVAYFSRAGENYSFGGRVDLEVGNTAVLVRMLAGLADVDLHEIRPADPYPDDYDATVRRNVEEQDTDARPAVMGAAPDVRGYDTVVLASGVWNVRAPMVMRTFVESVDLTGLRVLPLVTFAVSGMGRVAEDYVAMLPGSTHGEGLAVRGEEVAGAEPELRAWMSRVGLRATP